MATPSEQLKARRDKLLAEIAALTSSPDYSADGVSFQNSANRSAMYQELREINALLDEMGDDGPSCEESSIAIT
jgi:hypothetical protein